MSSLVGSAPTMRQFDFWLGSWDLAWEPSGRAVNQITAILDDRVILERFDGRPSIPLQGVSLSIYDPEIARWRQTWMDNQAGFLDFVGGMQGDRMVLERSTAEGLRQRMVWFDIEPEALRWNWERSDDDGSSWSVVWAIRYRRRGLDAAPLGAPSF